MKWTKATKEQLWTIIRADAECPLPLMEGVFQEAVARGLIKQYIISVIKKKFGSSETAQEQLKMTHEDLIQLGYEGALKAIKNFEPGKGSFSTILFLNISHAFGHHLQYIQAEKRKKNEVSYNALISEGSSKTMDVYLVDYHTNVEKTVLTKIQLEEKLSLLSPVQKTTFIQFYKGFTYNEIAEQMNTKKSTIAKRMKEALYRMAGQNVNLKELGIFERVSFKKQGA